MPCVETKIVINGDSKPIFEIIKNMEAYPSFVSSIPIIIPRPRISAMTEG